MKRSQLLAAAVLVQAAIREELYISGRENSSSQLVRHIVTDLAHMSMDSRKSRLLEKGE